MLYKKLEKTIYRYGLIAKSDRVLVAVSGGADSVALLYLLHSLAEKMKFRICAAHLDHMLRPGSARDRQYVEGLCRRLKITLTCGKVNIKKLSTKRSRSLEEAARDARLAFLVQAAKKNYANKIALAHNLDDQAETVLMRILRGTGMQGLVGMLPKRRILNFEVIRPLIQITRKEIEAFLKEIKVKPRRDPTNKAEIFFRNKIRHRLLLLLEKEYNPNIKAVLSGLAENVGYDYDYLRASAFKLKQRLGSRLNLKSLKKMHPAIRRMLLRMKISDVQGSTRRITFKHIKELEDLLLGRPTNSLVNLPKGLCVVKKKNRLSFFRR